MPIGILVSNATPIRSGILLDLKWRWIAHHLVDLHCSLIYIERNWHSILFLCMVLASKVWDDLSMWNCEFSKIGPLGVTFSLSRMKALDAAQLRALEYKHNVKVGTSAYAK